MQKNLSELTPKQQEFISVAELYCFQYRFAKQPVRRQTLENVFPLLRGPLLSRIDGVCDESIFNTGIYAIQNGAPRDPIEYHFDRGGDSSLFRGTTVTQSEDITHQEGGLIRYHAISFFGVSVLDLNQAFSDYPTLCEELFGRKHIQLFLEEAETVVPRPIPPENIREIVRTSRGTNPCRNRNFLKSKINTINLSWKDLFLSLYNHNCLNGGET